MGTALALYFDSSRLPELFCGFRRRDGKPPTAYPVACSPQAWSAGAVGLNVERRRGRVDVVMLS
jgi:glycogen debranching enzyme